MQILDWVQKFAAADPELSGQICFDFMRNDANRTLYCIECESGRLAYTSAAPRRQTSIDAATIWPSWHGIIRDTSICSVKHRVCRLLSWLVHCSPFAHSLSCKPLVAGESHAVCVRAVTIEDNVLEHDQQQSNVDSVDSNTLRFLGKQYLSQWGHFLLFT